MEVNKGLKNFTVIWIGQFVSLMGTAMTRFALLIWAYSQTEKAMTTALLGFFAILPYILFSPIAGVVIDRFNKKTIMILSDLGAGLTTILILILFITGRIEIWHLFLLEFLCGAFEAFQVPAYTSSVTLLVDKKNYTRASGMRSLSSNVSTIVAPVLAGILMFYIELTGLLIVDLITFLIAMATLSIVKIPSIKPEKFERKSMLQDIKEGLSYLFNNKGLWYLMLMFTLINLVSAITYFGILPAMILARSNNNELVLASVQSALGVGGVVGSLIISIFAFRRNKIKIIFISAFCSFLIGDLLLALGNSVTVWSFAAFSASLFIPILMGLEASIWQSKVNPNMQGRIFSLKGMINMSTMPIGYLLGGILADYVFEPFMQNTNIFNNLFGVGLGSGMAMMFFISGILGATISILALLFKDLRNLEVNIPDFK